MEAGQLDHYVTIQRLVQVQGPTGVITDTWQTFKTAWVKVKPLSGQEFISGGITGSKVTATIHARYLDVVGVMPSMRIIDGAQVYNVEGVLPDQRTGRENITLPVSEVQHG